MLILKTLKDLRAWRTHINGSVGFVPTMGALHAGHLSLAERSLVENETTIASIFVNPTQFAPHEDFDTYPRTLEKDVELLENIGVSTIWAPPVSEIYPDNFQTSVRVSGVSEVLEGTFRSDHFEGVTIVVNKLFMQVQPTRAYFGEKDYQQLAVLRKMVEDLNIPVEIVGCPIIRDDKGLALSSRNAYLNPSELKIAQQLNGVLKQASDLIKTISIQESEHQLEQNIIDLGFHKVDYITLRCAKTLQEITSIDDQETRILVAAFLGTVRLIDNMEI